MKLLFNAVGKLQTAIECPTCKRTGKETMFTECCCKYVLGLMGICSTQREMNYNAETFLRDKDGCCYEETKMAAVMIMQRIIKRAANTTCTTG